jgi:hypothetical protein
MRIELGVSFSFALAFLAGAVGVISMITGAVMLARETTFSFRVLREEKKFITGRVLERVAQLIGTAPANRA